MGEFFLKNYQLDQKSGWNFNKEKGTFKGEDFAFCERWTKIGGKLYANVDAYITHHGDYSYKGRFIDEGAKIK